MIIVGITGTLGAGKGEVVAHLKGKGFAHFSARDFLIEEVLRRGLTVNRDTTTAVANDLRTNHSPSYVLEQLYAHAVAAGAEKAILESVRTPGEVDFLKTKSGFYLIGVDADPKLRYERITHRKSALDHVSFEKFLSDEAREMTSTNPNEGNISECLRRADVVVRNDGSLAELAAAVDGFLPKIV